LAGIYKNGRGIAKDWQKAYFWYEIASVRKDTCLDDELVEISHHIPSQQKADIDKKASAWLKSHHLMEDENL